MFKNIQLPSPKSVISVAASVTATAMLIRSLSRDLIPQELRYYFFNKLNYFLTKFTNDITVIIDEYEGLNKNQLFQASELYLSTIITPSTKNFRASLPEKEKKIHFSVGGNEEITDNFCGIFLKWRLVHEKSEARYVPYGDEFHSNALTEVKYLVLTFHKKFKNKVVDEYLPYVLEKSKALKDEKKTLKLHTLKNDIMHGGTRMNPWQSVNLDHPAKFETLAMDDEIKSMIVDDLDRFVKRREFYRKVGKAWKRGYLLFGPPGTGKLSLIAAMANYLNFDVYDLELTDLRSNSDLRRLLISTANRSIFVVEDIDASIDLSQRKKTALKSLSQMYPSFAYDQGPKVTLSGLLNFIDGLWSSCGDERIIIFTTNHIEKLDPALLRPGRMDVHIHMSYCTPCGFKMLVSNYLGISNHPLATEAERLIASAKVTPAEIGEQLLKGEDPELVLRGLIEFIELKKESENAREEFVEVTKEEVVMFETENSESGDGLKELVKMGDESCSEVRTKILKNGEAANALRILVQLLEREIGAEKVEDSGVSLGSSEVGIVSENGKEEGMKSE